MSNAKVCIHHARRFPSENPSRPLSEFGKAKYSPTGLRYECSRCCRLAQKDARLRKAALIEKARATVALAQPPPPPADAIDEFEITVEEPAPEAVPAPAADSDFQKEYERQLEKNAALIPPTPQERLEITRLKRDLTHAKAELREAEKFALTSEGLRELVGSLGSPNVTTAPEWLKGAAKPRSVTGTGVLFLSDIHFHEVVLASQIGNCNAYDGEIATRRLRNTFKSAIVLLKSFMASPRYDGLVLPLGGDLLSGNIHEELIKTNEAPIQMSMLELEQILIEGIGGLADEFGKLHIPCVTGNHGRMSRKPEAKNRAAENFEWSIYQRLAAWFKKDNRITFDIPDGSDAYFSIYNRRFCLTHGDQFRGGGGIGGIMVPIMRGVSKKQVRQAAIKDPFDTVMMGHWHQYIHMDGLIINGSVKGYDEYAYQQNFAFEPPQQALFVVHPEVGCTFRMPVMCSYEGGRASLALGAAGV